MTLLSVRLKRIIMARKILLTFSPRYPILPSCPSAADDESLLIFLFLFPYEGSLSLHKAEVTRLRTVSAFFAFLLLFPPGCALLNPGDMQKCLPGGIYMDTRFSPDEYPRKPTTVREKLIQLGAYSKD